MYLIFCLKGLTVHLNKQMSHSCLNCGKRYDTEEKLKRHEKNCDRSIPSTPTRSASRSVSVDDKSNQLIKLIESESNRVVGSSSFKTSSSSTPISKISSSKISSSGGISTDFSVYESRLKALERDCLSLKSEIKNHDDKFEMLGNLIDERLASSKSEVVKYLAPTPVQIDKTYEDVECKLLKRTIESQKVSFLKNLNHMQTQVDQYKKRMDDMDQYNSNLQNDFDLLLDGYNKKIIELEKDIQQHYIEEYKKNIKSYKDKSDLCDLLQQKLEEMEVERKSITEKERTASRLKDECLARLNEMNKKTVDIVKERNELSQRCNLFEDRVKDLDSREKLLSGYTNRVETLQVELDNKKKIIDELMIRLEQVDKNESIL
jgi:DNA repair exonuclease SbcCD ATPase subunit